MPASCRTRSTPYIMPKMLRGQDRLMVKIKIHEGNKFVFRNITFSGNTIYPTELLSKHLRINKGDPYNRTLLETNLTYNPSGTDITSMYMDNGYLFFNATPVEVGVENDSIDIEIRIIEGKQARIRNVIVEGNTITNDKVIMRELHTRPGDLFSRDAIMRSRRELATLGYFKEESIMPDAKPNDQDGTVDIIYKVEEGQHQPDTAAGRLWQRNAYWSDWPDTEQLLCAQHLQQKGLAALPAGDGQKLSFNAVTNGTYYYSFSGSFTEPWLGGRRPQSLSVSIYHHFISNGYFYKKSDSRMTACVITGGGVSLTKRLKWPDDYFIISHSLSYKHYNLHNYTILAGTAFTDGKANDLSYGITISRNSLDSPIYARSGSEISVSGYVTPPYSAMNGKDYTDLMPRRTSTAGWNTIRSTSVVPGCSILWATWCSMHVPALAGSGPTTRKSAFRPSAVTLWVATASRHGCSTDVRLSPAWL